MYITYCGVPKTRDGASQALRSYKQVGVTSIQTYIFWNEIEKEPGVYDWTQYDDEVKLYQEHGLKWIPFIILGPFYTTPDWVRKITGDKFYRCLEHGREGGAISLWNQTLRPLIDRFMAAFAAHYLPKDILESVLLGITGDYGEAIYPVFGNWPLDYHTHYGFWCGDEFAIRDYEGFLRKRYGDVQQLNNDLHTHFPAFDAIRPVLRKDATWKQWLVQMEWYRNSMNVYAEFWMETAKQHFPDVPIYLCTGGRGKDCEGSDFSLQAKTCAPFNARIRITNESSDYFVNFISTRLVASACKFYGIGYGFEPCSATTARGMLARVFNVLSSGAEQLFDYVNNNLEYTESAGFTKKKSFAVLGKYQSLLQSGRFANPQVDVAILIPNTQWTLDGDTYPAPFIEKTKQLRALIDFDFVDERMVADGALKRYRYLITYFTSIVDGAIIPNLIDWVNGGGIFITTGRLETVDGPSEKLDRLIGLAQEHDEVWGVQRNDVLVPEFLRSVLRSDKPYITKRGFINFVETVAVLAQFQGKNPFDPTNQAEAHRRGASIWCNRYGGGLSFVYTGPMGIDLDTWMEDPTMYTRLIQDCLFNITAFDAAWKNLLQLHAAGNDVFATQFADGVLVVNLSDAGVIWEYHQRQYTIPSNEIVFVQ